MADPSATNLDLIRMLAIGFTGALALGYLTHRLGWSSVVGYLLAGVLVGPHTPGFVADRHLAEQLSEVGVILLMFGVGLHFHLKDLLAVRTIAIAGAIFQSAAATALGAFVAHSFGWNWSAGIVFGLALSVASTVVLVRVLSDNGALQSPIGRVAVGWLVMEDILTVFVLVLLPVMFAPSGDSGNLAGALGMAVLKLSVFVGFTLVAGARVVPWLLTKIASTRSRELFTLSVLAVALGIAAGSAYFFGVSMALGAFLAGMVVGQSEFSARAAAEALPMRDAFAVLFFLAVGMLFNPTEALHSPLLILVTVAIVVVGKPLAALVIVALLGYSSRIGLGVAIALAQVGEFSFLLAALGTQLGVLPQEAMNPIVATAIISTMLNPMLYRSVGAIDRFLLRHPRLWRILNLRAGAGSIVQQQPRTTDPSHTAVVVGYGPIGQTVTRLLRDRGIEPTIIEMNIETVKALGAKGTAAVYGDANQLEVLEKAGIGSASSFILSSSGAVSLTESIRKAREMNPGVHVVARADFLRETDQLKKVGADEVFSGEGEVAIAMTDSILRNLGTTPEQLDEAREWIRARLFKASAA